MGESRRGLFIVLEGIDASGSTTQAERLTAYLRGRGDRVVTTREPSDGPAGMLIRLALARRLSGPNEVPVDSERAEPAYTPLDPRTLALLFAADRVDHVTTRILPALERGHHVVCDRYTLSSLAYQGLHVDQEWLLAINRFAPTPDLTVLLDVPARDADLRIRKSRMTRDHFEELHTQEAVQRRYEEVARAAHSALGRIEIVEATAEIAAVEEKVRTLVDELLTR